MTTHELGELIDRVRLENGLMGACDDLSRQEFRFESGLSAILSAIADEVLRVGSGEASAVALADLLETKSLGSLA